MKAIRASRGCSIAKTRGRLPVRMSNTSSCGAHYVPISVSHNLRESYARGLWYDQRASTAHPHFKEGM